MPIDYVLTFQQGENHLWTEKPAGEAEQHYCEIYETMPAIVPPTERELAIMFADSVIKGVELYGNTVCYGVLIFTDNNTLAYGNDGFIGVVYGCVACCGLSLANS